MFLVGVSGASVYHAHLPRLSTEGCRLVERRPFEAPLDKPALMKGLITGLFAI